MWCIQDMRYVCDSNSTYPGKVYRGAIYRYRCITCPLERAIVWYSINNNPVILYDFIYAVLKIFVTLLLKNSTCPTHVPCIGRNTLGTSCTSLLFFLDNCASSENTSSCGSAKLVMMWEWMKHKQCSFYSLKLHNMVTHKIISKINKKNTLETAERAQEEGPSFYHNNPRTSSK